MRTNDGMAFSSKNVKLMKRFCNIKIVILVLMHLDDLLPIAYFK